MCVFNFLVMVYRYKYYFIFVCIEICELVLIVKINSLDKENILLCREFKVYYVINNGRDYCLVWFF